jgi:hypothetical protein
MMMTELSYIGCSGIGIVGTCMQGGCRPDLMICNQRMISAAVDMYLAMHCMPRRLYTIDTSMESSEKSSM